MHGDVFDPGLFLAFIIAALYLGARPLIEWLILPGMRRNRRTAATPYDWPRWVYRLRLALADRRRTVPEAQPGIRVRPYTPAPRSGDRW